MQKYFLKFAGLAMVLTAILVSSCEEDENPPIDNPLPPIVQLLSDAGFISSDATVMTGEVFKVRLEALPGDNPLQSVTVLEDGANLATGRFEVSGISTTNNPFLVTGADKDGVTYEISITAPSEFSRTNTLTFRVTDERQETDEVSIDITTEDEPATPVELIEGILFNRAGPTGRGALDLDDGIGTGTTTGDFQLAEIKDEGINQNLPQATNWKRQISGINGSVVRTLGANTPEGFKFEDVNTLEAVIALFDDGDALPLMNAQNEPVSETVEVGDVFVVKRDDNYYLIQIDEVNEVHVGTNQPGNNDDNYVISIKR